MNPKETQAIQKILSEEAIRNAKAFFLFRLAGVGIWLGLNFYFGFFMEKLLGRS